MLKNVSEQEQLFCQMEWLSGKCSLLKWRCKLADVFPGFRVGADRWFCWRMGLGPVRGCSKLGGTKGTVNQDSNSWLFLCRGLWDFCFVWALPVWNARRLLEMKADAELLLDSELSMSWKEPLLDAILLWTVIPADVMMATAPATLWDLRFHQCNSTEELKNFIKENLKMIVNMLNDNN